MYVYTEEIYITAYFPSVRIKPAVIVSNAVELSVVLRISGCTPFRPTGEVLSGETRRSNAADIKRCFFSRRTSISQRLYRRAFRGSSLAKNTKRERE